MAPIAAVRRPIPQVLPVGLTACIVVAAGTPVPGAAGLLNATSATPSPSTTASGCALSSPSNVLGKIHVADD